MNLLDAVEFESSVHARRRQPLRVSSEANSGGCCCVVVEDFQLRPLLAQVDSAGEISSYFSRIRSNSTSFSPDVGSSDRQIRSALIEAQILDLVAILQLNRLEVFQFSQIPELHARIRGSCRQIVAVFGEGNRADLASVSGEVRHVALLLQVPNQHLCVLSSCAKDQTVRMELGCSQTALG